MSFDVHERNGLVCAGANRNASASIANPAADADLTATREAQIRALPLPELEGLAEGLLAFQGADDLDAWLAAG